jgi:hypothetical protein
MKYITARSTATTPSCPRSPPPAAARPSISTGGIDGKLLTTIYGWFAGATTP